MSTFGKYLIGQPPEIIRGTLSSLKKKVEEEETRPRPDGKKVQNFNFKIEQCREVLGKKGINENKN